jgi:hypothetical protein
LVKGDGFRLYLPIDGYGHVPSFTKGGGIEPVAMLEVWVYRKRILEAHERWEYDTDTRVQRLVGLIALCPSCHEVKHIGRAFAVGRGVQAVKHLRKVNGWSEQECADYLDAARAEWEERSRHEWTLDISFVEGLSR